MQEQVILFETAKLAMEKGFNIPCRDFYSDLSWGSTELYHAIDMGYSEFLVDDDGAFGDVIHAPTQSLLQKWVRDTFGIHTDIYRIGFRYAFTLECMITGNSRWSNDNNYETYEDALEDALQAALKLIETNPNNNTLST